MKKIFLLCSVCMSVVFTGCSSHKPKVVNTHYDKYSIINDSNKAFKELDKEK